MLRMGYCEPPAVFESVRYSYKVVFLYSVFLAMVFKLCLENPAETIEGALSEKSVMVHKCG